MYRGNADVGEVDRNLGDSVFLDEPADGFAGLERSRNIYRVAFLILDDFSGYRIPFTHGASFLTDIESYGVGASC
jgi:hypothetical protein